MSSAIEDKVVVELIYKSIFNYETTIDESIAMRNWVKKALLALEQKESLKEWLEKEIKGKEMLKVHLQYQAKESIEIEINQLKEVLERVGEQK